MDALNQIVDGSAPSTWKALFISICYYSTLPFVTVFTTTLNVLLVVSSPLIHLLSYVAHLLLLPLSIVGKLEVSTHQVLHQHQWHIPNPDIDSLRLFRRCGLNWSSYWSHSIFCV